jgi:hypothetical protein
MKITKTLIIKHKFSHRFNQTNNHKIILTFKQKRITITLTIIENNGQIINHYRHRKS